MGSDNLDYTKLAERMEEVKRRREEVIGRLSFLKQKLLEDFGLSSIEEAKGRLNEIGERIDRLETILGKKVQKLESLLKAKGFLESQ